MNLCLKYGLVSDVKPGFAKVNFAEDSIVSDWLPVVVRKTKTQKESWQLEIDEHVICLMTHDCDEGVIIGAIPNEKDTPDPGEGKGKFRKLFEDGTVIEYDTQVGKLTIDVKGDLLAKAAGSVDIEAIGTLKASSQTSAEIQAPEINCKATVSAAVEAPLITLKGNVAVTGTLTVAAEMTAATIATTGSGSITSQGNMTVEGDINATGSVNGAVIKAGSIDLVAHRHSAPSGGGLTGSALP